MDPDPWGLVPIGQGASVSPVSLPWRTLLEGAASLLRGPDQAAEAERALRLQYLSCQVTQLRGDPLVPVWMQFPDFSAAFASAPADLVLLGRRGGGKTAAGVSLCASAWRASPNGTKFYAAGLPPWACEAVGAVPVELSEAGDLRNAVLFVDEAGLLARAGARKRGDAKLTDLLALSRHRGLWLVWASQSGAVLDREVFKFGPGLGFVGVDPLAARFEREELADLMRRVVAFQAGRVVPAGELLCFVRGRWVVTGVPLPQGWTEDVSTCHGLGAEHKP